MRPSSLRRSGLVVQPAKEVLFRLGEDALRREVRELLEVVDVDGDGTVVLHGRSVLLCLSPGRANAAGLSLCRPFVAADGAN
jgi:hypothetical protein